MFLGFTGGSDCKESACNAGDLCLIPGSLRPWVRRIPWRREWLPTPVFLGFPGGSDGKESACNAGDLGSVPGLGRSSGEGDATHSSVLAGESNRWRRLVGYSP